MPAGNGGNKGVGAALEGLISTAVNADLIGQGIAVGIGEDAVQVNGITLVDPGLTGSSGALALCQCGSGILGIQHGPGGDGAEGALQGDCLLRCAVHQGHGAGTGQGGPHTGNREAAGDDRIIGGIGGEQHGQGAAAPDMGQNAAGAGDGAITQLGPAVAVGGGIADGIGEGRGIVGIGLAAAGAGALCKVVAQGSGLVSDVAVAAAAGVGGIAALGAGGSGHHGLVAVLMDRLLHGDADTAGGGADILRVIHTILARHGKDILACFQSGGIGNQLTVFVGGAQVGPVGDTLGGNVIHGSIVHIQTVGVQVLGGAVGEAQVGTGVVQGQGDLLAPDGIPVVSDDIIEDAVAVAVEAPAGEMAQGDDIAVPEEDLIGSRAPAVGGQGVLIVDIVVQVAVAAPELIHKAAAHAAGDGKHLRAQQTLVIQVALTGLLRVDAAVENLKSIDVQVQQGHLALGVLGGAGLKVTAGQAVAVIAVAFGDKVVFLQAVQGQIEIGHGDVLHRHDGIAAGTNHKALIRGQGQHHINGADRLDIFCKGRHGEHSQDHDKGQDQGKQSFHIHNETSLSNSLYRFARRALNGVSRLCTHGAHLLKLREATQFVGLLTCMSSDCIPPSRIAPMTCFRRRNAFSILTAPRHGPPCPGISPEFPCSAEQECVSADCSPGRAFATK